MQAIESINKWLNGVVWGIPMMCLILGTGVYLCIRCGFPQFAHFGHIMKNTLGKAFEKSEDKEGSVSPFKAMSTALRAPSPSAAPALSSGCGYRRFWVCAPSSPR